MSLTAVWLLSMVAAAPAPGTLAGYVMDENGAPIAGALVDLYTAKPRVGLAVTCPSCYRDCAKSTKTDAEGRFSIDELDPRLLFRVLVLAPARRPVLTKLIDPAQTDLEVILEPLPADLPKNRMLTGRVFDEHVKPLVGAVVSPTGAKTHGQLWWGPSGADEAAVTDTEGRFVITSPEPKSGLALKVSAPGYADFPSKLFDLDGSEHEIHLRRGASVSGRLKFQEKPVKGRAIGIVQRDRSAGHFVGETTLGTDDEGGFTFVNLQPNERYVLYSLCDASQELPVLKTVSLETGGDGQETRLGELPLLKGLTLAGRVELPQGAAMPDGAKLRVSRDPAWDWCEALLPDDGEFEIRSLPPEVYSISVIVPGFEIDASRIHYQVIGASDFALRLRDNGDKPLLHVVVPMIAK